MDKSNTICFEMPTHDLMRHSLKFESLYRLVTHYMDCRNEYDHRMAINALTDLLVLLDRPELRSKYFQEFTRFRIYLDRLNNTTDIDQSRLNNILSQLQQQLHTLEKDSGKFVPGLRNDRFFRKIIQYRNQAVGDDCAYNTPAYYSWLQQDIEKRQEDMLQWMTQFEDVAGIIGTYLKLVRHTGHYQTHTAPKGFYQQAIDPKLTCHLIQIRLEKALAIYPKISVGRHGLSIRFVNCDETRDETQEISFELSCCNL